MKTISKSLILVSLLFTQYVWSGEPETPLAEEGYKSLCEFSEPTYCHQLKVMELLSPIQAHSDRLKNQFCIMKVQDKVGSHIAIFEKNEKCPSVGESFVGHIHKLCHRESAQRWTQADYFIRTNDVESCEKDLNSEFASVKEELKKIRKGSRMERVENKFPLLHRINYKEMRTDFFKPPGILVQVTTDSTQSRILSLHASRYVSDEATCSQLGGNWLGGLPSSDQRCNLPTLDAGETCRSSSECESLCVARSDQGVTGKGVCFPRTALNGACIDEVVEGKPTGVSCPDQVSKIEKSIPSDSSPIEAQGQSDSGG